MAGVHTRTCKKPAIPPAGFTIGYLGAKRPPYSPQFIAVEIVLLSVKQTRRSSAVLPPMIDAFYNRRLLLCSNLRRENGHYWLGIFCINISTQPPWQTVTFYTHYMPKCVSCQVSDGTFKVLASAIIAGLYIRLLLGVLLFRACALKKSVAD
jgi:hypothetical protein